MASFEELMNTFRNPGDEGLPETFADDLAAAYENDLSIRDAAVTEKENALTESQSAIAQREAEINRLKAVNYDLLMAAPKAGNGDNNQEPEDAPKKGGIDSLFE